MTAVNGKHLVTVVRNNPKIYTLENLAHQNITAKTTTIRILDNNSQFKNENRLVCRLKAPFIVSKDTEVLWSDRQRYCVEAIPTAIFSKELTRIAKPFPILAINQDVR